MFEKFILPHTIVHVYLVVELLVELLPTESLQGVQDWNIAIFKRDVGHCHQTNVPKEGVCYPVGLGGPLEEKLNHWG